MRGFTIPARYRPELEQALGSTLRQIRCDMKLRELDPRAHYVLADETLHGDLVVLIGDGPETQTEVAA